MNENIKEKISALADGELSEFEVRRVLDEIEKEPDLRNYWDLLQITRRSLINEDFFELPTNDSPEQILMAQSLKDTIYDALSGLPEDTRTALSLREFEGLNYEEIAEIMNCPVGTVRSRIFRGREALENLISPITDKFKVMNNKEIV